MSPGFQLFSPTPNTFLHPDINSEVEHSSVFSQLKVLLLPVSLVLAVRSFMFLSQTHRSDRVAGVAMLFGSRIG